MTRDMGERVMGRTDISTDSRGPRSCGLGYMLCLAILLADSAAVAGDLHV